MIRVVFAMGVVPTSMGAAMAGSLTVAGRAVAQRHTIPVVSAGALASTCMAAAVT